MFNVLLGFGGVVIPDKLFPVTTMFPSLLAIRGQVHASSVKSSVPLFKGAARTGFGRERILSDVTILLDSSGVFAIPPGRLGSWYTLARMKADN